MLLEHVRKRIDDYKGLKINGKLVSTPYYINSFEQNFNSLLKKAQVSEEQMKQIHQMYKDREIPYGWYRGKGTPEELEASVPILAEKVDFILENANEYGIVEFMKLFGLGVDCSGFVFNVLKYAFEKEGRLDWFMQQLAWTNSEKRGVNYAGVFVFASEKLPIINPSDIRPLDLLLLKSRSTGQYVHMALAYEDNSQLQIAESSINSDPTGIHITKVTINNGKPYFNGNLAMGKSFDKHIESGALEIRRLLIDSAI
jgi:hypothetical protein